jgi:hypothetical protein
MAASACAVRSAVRARSGNGFHGGLVVDLDLSNERTKQEEEFSSWTSSGC